MHSTFLRARWPILMAVACVLAAAKAGAQCTNPAITTQPVSLILTNTSGDGFQTTIDLSTSSSPAPTSFQYRRGGAGFGDFGPWTLTSSGSGSGGWYTGNSSGNGGGGTNNDIGYSWGLWANGGKLVNATRLFSATNAIGASAEFGNPAYNAAPVMPLPVGVTFGVDMDNGYITSGQSVGISLQNAAGQNLWEWYFTGGASDYSYHDNAGYNSSTLGWSQDGMHIAFTLTSTNTYSATVRLTSGGSVTVSGTLISQSDNRIVQLRAFNSSAGSGSAYDFFVNNLSILDKTDNAFTPTYLSPRSWVNGDGSGWDLHNGSNSGFFLGSSSGNGGGIGFVGPLELEPSQNCWGIFANSGDVADALRPFGQPLYVSNIVVLTMDNGFVTNNSSVGFGFQSGATNRFEPGFPGFASQVNVGDIE